MWLRAVDDVPWFYLHPTNDVICVHSLCVDALWVGLWKHALPLSLSLSLSLSLELDNVLCTETGVATRPNPTTPRPSLSLSRTLVLRLAWPLELIQPLPLLV